MPGDDLYPYTEARDYDRVYEPSIRRDLAARILDAIQWLVTWGGRRK